MESACTKNPNRAMTCENVVEHGFYLIRIRLFDSLESKVSSDILRRQQKFGPSSTYDLTLLSGNVK